MNILRRLFGKQVTHIQDRVDLVSPPSRSESVGGEANSLKSITPAQARVKRVVVHRCKKCGHEVHKEGAQFWCAWCGSWAEGVRKGKRRTPVGITSPAGETIHITDHCNASKDCEFQIGDIVGGKYEVRGIVGRGGFGIVYLVFSHEIEELCALKTFHHSGLAAQQSEESFKKEALVWMGLGRDHPHILAARWVEQLSERLFVAMDYIRPDENGCVTLDDHLRRAAEPLDANLVLDWAIQFCFGMEYANANGIKCHRDIKPSNILIGKDLETGKEKVLKIADFGLAAAVEAAWRCSAVRVGTSISRHPAGNFGFSFMQAGENVRCGTPGYMPPEVYRCEKADVRSDIYSFGLVLWQMFAGSPIPPFVSTDERNIDEFLRSVYEKQMKGNVPPLSVPFTRVINRCLEPVPSRRYGSFSELRKDLAAILFEQAGRTVEAPVLSPQSAASWSDKGVSLHALGRFDEALVCYERAIAIDSRTITAWNNKGMTLRSLGRHKEALYCYDRSLAIEQRQIIPWINKGNCLGDLTRHKEAIECYNQALKINPQDPLNAFVYYRKALAHDEVRQVASAVDSYRRFIQNASAPDEKMLAYARKRLMDLGTTA